MAVEFNLNSDVKNKKAGARVVTKEPVKIITRAQGVLNSTNILLSARV